MVAVIGVVIGVFLHPFPAAFVQQKRLHLRQIFARHHDVEVANRSAVTGKQPSGGISSALKQHDLAVIVRQSAPGAIGLPKRGPPLIFCVDLRFG